LLVCVFLACALAARLKWHELDASYSFETYLGHYGKTYPAEEYHMRKSIFEANLNKILAHNQDSSKTWKEEINHLADWTKEELKTLSGYNKKMGYARRSRSLQQAPVIPSLVDSLPASVDWRQQGVVSAVKDQGHCGSCWTFATAETIESHWAINTSQLWDLSEQQILDCTSNPQHCGGQGGCQGGTVEVAIASIIKAGGLSSEWTYPYVSYQGKDFPTCGTVTPAVKVANYVVLPPNEYQPLLNAVATIGPIAISVDASTWHFYATGVFNGCNQTNPDLNHAVQLVGYGVEHGHNYWLVRNSWSPSWGEEGYIKILRTPTVQCGVDLNPADGDGCDGGPPNVTVCGTCGILYDNVYPVISL